MKILCVIPCRISSTRLPRKPLLAIQGKPLIQWVYENACNCHLLTKVVVATDSEEIAAVITSCGGTVAMTKTAVKTGSDRVALVAEQYPEMELVINLQGDEPFVQPAMLAQLVAPYLAGEEPEMATLARPLEMTKDYADPRIVKVITNLRGEALYFSRSPIPYMRNATQIPLPTYHHIGIYAFRRDFLRHYRTLPQTPLEQAEALEQLRALEHGYTIKVSLTTTPTLEINDAKDLAAAQNFTYNLQK